MSQLTFCSDDFAQVECKRFELCDSYPNAFDGCWELNCTALLGCQARRQVPKQMGWQRCPCDTPLGLAGGCSSSFALDGVAAGKAGRRWRRACSAVLHSCCLHLIRKGFFFPFSLVYVSGRLHKLEIVLLYIEPVQPL